MSSLPSTILRSITAATRIASADAPSTTCILGLAECGLAEARATGARAAFADAFEPFFTARLGDDIKVLAFLQRLVLLQPHFAIADALAGLHVVFHAVPRADEVHFVFREEQAHRRLVGAKPLLDLGDGQTFASRAALVQAEITVSVKLAIVLEHADLVVADEDDPALAVLHFRKLCDKFFRHMRSTLAYAL